MEQILLTGARGFIGMNLARSVLENGFQLVLFNRGKMDEASRAYLEEAGTFSEETGDICDLQRLKDVMQKYQISQVIHGAALTPRDSVEKEWMSKTLDVNCVGAVQVLQAARDAGAKRFIYAGSVAVYGDACQESALIREDECPYRIHTTYEISKFTSEHLIKRFSELSGMETVNLRIADAFGPWERPTNSRTMMSVPFQVLLKAMKGERAVIPREGRMGWVYSKDIGNQAAAMLKKPPCRQAYHGSSIYQWSILDFGKELKKYFPKFEIELDRIKKNCNIFYFGERDNGMFSMDAVEEDYGFIPEYDLGRAVKDYVEWALTHKELLI